MQEKDKYKSSKSYYILSRTTNEVAAALVDDPRIRLLLSFLLSRARNSSAIAQIPTPPHSRWEAGPNGGYGDVRMEREGLSRWCVGPTWHWDGGCMSKPLNVGQNSLAPAQVLKVNSFDSWGTGTRPFCIWGLKLDWHNSWGAKSGLNPSLFSFYP